MKDIAVSIICNTYNHEKYVEDAIESFLKQKTKFYYEILIHDDASTDRTVDIIRKYEHEYPDLIKPIYETENQYSKNQGIIYTIQCERAKGKYIALCEGDDYWIDEYKLQKQYEQLEMHPEVDICATAAAVIMGKNKKIINYISPQKESGVIETEKIITGGGGYVATATLMYRKKLNENQPCFRQRLILDYTLQIQGSLRGGLLYLNDITAAYRFMTEGSWTKRTSLNRNKAISFIKKINVMLLELDRETDGLYSNAIQQTICKNEFNILFRMGNLREIKSDKYLDLYRKLTVKDKINIYIKYYLPWLLKIKYKDYQ